MISAALHIAHSVTSHTPYQGIFTYSNTPRARTSEVGVQNRLQQSKERFIHTEYIYKTCLVYIELTLAMAELERPNIW